MTSSFQDQSTFNHACLLRLDKQQLTNISFHKQVTHLLLVWLQSLVAFISQKFDLRANNPCDQIWQNYATLAKYLKSWAILGGYLLLGKIQELLGQIFYAIGQPFGHINGQMLKNNLAIWSHWKQPPNQVSTRTSKYILQSMKAIHLPSPTQIVVSS